METYVDSNEYPAIVTNSIKFEETVYEREDYILDKFERHIETNYNGKDAKTLNFFSAIITVPQSPGYGKSKLMESFGSRMPTFYTTMQGGSGCLFATFFLTRLIEELDKIVSDGIRKVDRNVSFCYVNNISIAIYIYILLCSISFYPARR
jgi:hypothetical protein